jgi:hypothetical protein
MLLRRAATAVASAIPVAIGDPGFLRHCAVPAGAVLKSRTVDPLLLDAHQVFGVPVRPAKRGPRQAS